MKVWDLYDENLNNTHKQVNSIDEIPDGYYHIALELWIVNNKKQVLLTKNTIDYSRRYPGSWLCVGGSLQSGETYEDAIDRIMDKKIGLKINIDEKIISNPIKRNPFKYAYVTCVVFSDVDVNKIKFKDGNISDAKFVSKNELIKMSENGEIAYYLISRLDEVLKYLD